MFYNNSNPWIRVLLDVERQINLLHDCSRIAPLPDGSYLGVASDGRDHRLAIFERTEIGLEFIEWASESACVEDALTSARTLLEGDRRPSIEDYFSDGCPDDLGADVEDSVRDYLL